MNKIDNKAVPVANELDRTETHLLLMVAAFQCVRCHTILKIPQKGPGPQEPHECYREQGGCGRTTASTAFKLLIKESEFSNYGDPSTTKSLLLKSIS